MKTFLLSLFLSAPLILSAAEAIHSDCYARWDESGLVVGNSRFERSWSATAKGLTPRTFLTKNPGFSWLRKAGGRKPNSAALQVRAETARRSPVGSEGLRVEVSVDSSPPERTIIWVFPELAGTLNERLEGAAGSSATKEESATGIEKDPTRQATTAEPSSGETLWFEPGHIKFTEYTLKDQTDHHNELVHERSWLLGPSEGQLSIQGCIATIEDSFTGNGIAFLKLAPLPHARPTKGQIDFQVNPGRRSLTVFTQPYPVAMVAYQGSSKGRIAAFHKIQRTLRNYQPERDGMFLSNTWGDRNRDSRIQEEFLLKEIEAGAQLGVDIVQIDDGWQKGRSSNSSAANGKGVWNGYWAADPEFWTADPKRFPNGLGPVVGAARKHDMKFGLWFGPDSSNDAANWKRDADHLLGLHKKYGIDYFKIDSMKSTSSTAIARQSAMFARMLEGSDGAMTFDLDVTAEIRPGYFGLPEIGPIFLENRYTDWGSYWPHRTLRNLWKLSHFVDPLRLRIEVLNPARNGKNYGNDPLAPARYPADTLFAIAMVANPLGWFEVSNLPQDISDQMKPLVTVWKKERAQLHGGTIMPIGSAPDGVAWTGFASRSENATQVLLFRELNPNATFSLPLEGPSRSVTVLAGRGSATIGDDQLTVTIPETLDYLWVKVE